MSLIPRLPALLALITTASFAAELTTWPSQYTIRPWETSRLTAADVVGPDGIVYPDFTGVGVITGIPDVNNATLYFSVLLNINALSTGADNRLVINLGLDNSIWNIYLGQANGTSQWKYGDQSGAGAVLGTAVANQTVLIVGRLAFNSATQFVTEYWFNPVLGQPLGTPTYAKTYATTTSGGQFNGI